MILALYLSSAWLPPAPWRPSPSIARLPPPRCSGDSSVWAAFERAIHMAKGLGRGDPGKELAFDASAALDEMNAASQRRLDAQVEAEEDALGSSAETRLRQLAASLTRDLSAAEATRADAAARLAAAGAAAETQAARASCAEAAAARAGAGEAEARAALARAETELEASRDELEQGREAARAAVGS